MVINTLNDDQNNDQNELFKNHLNWLQIYTNDLGLNRLNYSMPIFH